MNKPEFKRAAQAAFNRANPGVRAKFAWTRLEKVTWHDKSVGFSGTVVPTVAGFKSRPMNATWSPTQGIMVR